MKDTTKIKTFAPHIPAGIGPTFIAAEDCITEIICDLEGNTACTVGEIKLTNDEQNKFVKLLVNSLNIADWEDGKYDLFPDYKIQVQTFEKWKLDEIPEFEGY